MTKRSKEDEQYVQCILKANAKSNKLYVMDARPKMNAIANVVSWIIRTQYQIFMACRVPIIAFHGVIYIYIYICGHLHEYVLYTQLRKLCHSGGLGKLMDVVRKRMLAGTTDQQEECKLAKKCYYDDTGINK